MFCKWLCCAFVVVCCIAFICCREYPAFLVVLSVCCSFLCSFVARACVLCCFVCFVLPLPIISCVVVWLVLAILCSSCLSLTFPADRSFVHTYSRSEQYLCCSALFAFCILVVLNFVFAANVAAAEYLAPGGCTTASIAIAVDDTTHNPCTSCSVTGMHCVCVGYCRWCKLPSSVHCCRESFSFCLS